MSCGSRVYKGDTVTISIPFDVDDYSNLTITYSTTGGEKIEKGQEEVEIEDGFITYTFEPGELDLLPDGVIYYTIACEVNGVPNVDSTNTPIYLATPAGYSGKTAEDIYQSGYTAGLADCSGYTPTDCTSAYTEGYMEGEVVGKAEGYTSGYTDGYAQGQAECSGESANLQDVVIYQPTDRAMENVFPDQGYDGMKQVMLLNGNLWNSAYAEGYTAGQAECSGGSCNLVDGSFNMYDGWYGDERFTPPSSADGFSSFRIIDTGYGDRKYADGFAAGQASTDCSYSIDRAYNSGYTNGYTNGYHQGQADCPECSGSSGCNLGDTWYDLMDDFTGQVILTLPDFNLGQGFDGITAITINDKAYGEAKYQQGYDDGISTRCSDLVSTTIIVPSGSHGIISNITPTGHAGFSSVSVNAQEYGQEQYNNGLADGYQSGYTAGQDSVECPTNVQGTAYGVMTGQVQTFYPDQGYDGMGSIVIDGTSFWNSASTEGYASGYSAGYDEGYQQGFDDCGDCDCSAQIETAGQWGYIAGKDSVIKSLLTENDTDLVIGYYYTSASTMCLITGEYGNHDGNSSFSTMSVNGGAWQPVEKYLPLSSGWTQIRFSGCTSQLNGTFSHSFTPSRDCYMDALKVVSVPSFIDGMVDTHTFHANDGLRVIASSCGIMRGVTSGADNINVVITHYKGNQRQYNNFPSSGVLFIPEGSTADWASTLSSWTHIEFF